VPGEAELVPLGAAADRGQELVHLVEGEPDAGVLDPQRAVARVLAGEESHRTRCRRVAHAARGDRVDGVLHQLPDVDAGTGIEVVAEQIDDAAQIDMERVAHEHPPPSVRRAM
jgi:hypothetical protein